LLKAKLLLCFFVALPLIFLQLFLFDETFYSVNLYLLLLNFVSELKDVGKVLKLNFAVKD